LDFSGATRLFADENFDGPPIRALIKDSEGKEPDAQTFDKDTITPEEIKEVHPDEEILLPRDEEEEKKRKIVIIAGGQVAFNVVSRVVSIIDPKTGKLTTESLTGYATHQLVKHFQTLDEFLKEWNKDVKKEVIIKELNEQGILFEELRKEVGIEDIDEFDLVMHLAYGKKPLTRRERVNEVKKRDVFGKYEGLALKVIEALLEQYAQHGIEAVDGIEDLKVAPFVALGTQVEIVNAFGGKKEFVNVLREMQNNLYQYV
jgi:type I restriction enzyme R subunit